MQPNTSALASLFGAGLLLGVTTNLGKVASTLGISPLAYLTWSLVGACAILLPLALWRGHMPHTDRRSLEYYFLAALLTVAGSNLIFFSVVGRLGVSFVVLMYALPPLLTYAGALLLGMEKFCRWRAAGVVLALAGTAYLVLGQWAASTTEPRWIAIALIGPVLLAIGNLYRTRRWPPGASAEALAPGMLIAAIVLLLSFAAAVDWPLALPTATISTVTLVAAQAVVFAGQFWLLFVLQKAGGPVFMSLMGGVSAVFAVPIARSLLAEPALPSWPPAAMLIAAGIISMLVGVKACQPDNHSIAGKVTT